MDRRLTIRLTDEEYILLCEKSDAANMTRAQYIRSIINSHNISPTDTAAPRFSPTAEFYDKLALCMASMIVNAKGKDTIIANEAAAIQAEFGISYETS